MNIYIEELEEKLKSELLKLKDANDAPLLASVEDTFTLTPNGYPYASFEIDNISGQMFDTCKNLRTYRFSLQIFRDFESLNGSEQEKRRIARKQVAKIVDSIIILLDKNESLDGLVDTSEVVEFQFGTYSKSEGRDGAGYMVNAYINLKKLIFIK